MSWERVTTRLLETGHREHSALAMTKTHVFGALRLPHQGDTAMSERASLSRYALPNAASSRSTNAVTAASAWTTTSQVGSKRCRHL